MKLVIIVASALKNCVFTQSLSRPSVSHCSIPFTFITPFKVGSCMCNRRCLDSLSFSSHHCKSVHLASWPARTNPFNSLLAQTGLLVQRHFAAVFAARCHRNTTFGFLLTKDSVAQPQHSLCAASVVQPLSLLSADSTRAHSLLLQTITCQIWLIAVTVFQRLIQ